MDTVKMQCPDEVTAISVAGKQYIADNNGIVKIPSEYESSVYCFGLVRAQESAGSQDKAAMQKKSVKGKI